jgi:hypothetical protein
MDPIDSIHFPFAMNPGLGRLRRERDFARHVDQMIRQVLLTAPGERISLPDLGAGLRRMVFAPLTDATAALVRTRVFENLNRWLGNLITVDDVTAEAVEETLTVTVTYTLKARRERRLLSLEVTV